MLFYSLSFDSVFSPYLNILVRINKDTMHVNNFTYISYYPSRRLRAKVWVIEKLLSPQKPTFFWTYAFEPFTRLFLPSNSLSSTTNEAISKSRRSWEGRNSGHLFWQHKSTSDPFLGFRLCRMDGADSTPGPRRRAHDWGLAKQNILFPGYDDWFWDGHVTKPGQWDSILGLLLEQLGEKVLSLHWRY